MRCNFYYDHLFPRKISFDQLFGKLLQESYFDAEYQKKIVLSLKVIADIHTKLYGNDISTKYENINLCEKKIQEILQSIL